MKNYIQRFVDKIVVFFEILLWIMVASLLSGYMEVYWAAVLSSFIVAAFSALFKE